MLPPISVPITLQVDANLLADEVISRIRDALYVGLSPRAVMQPPAAAATPVAVPAAQPAPTVPPAPPPPPNPPSPAIEPVPAPAPAPLPPSPATSAPKAEPEPEPGPELAACHNAAAPSEEPDQRTVRQWLVVYRDIVARKKIKDSTRTNTESNLKHVDRLWGHMPIRSLRPRLILSALQDGLDTDNLRGRVLSLMKRILKEAVMDEWVESNAALAVDSISAPVQRKRMSLDTLGGAYEVAMVHPQAWVAPMILLGVVTGQRRADLAKMKFSDVVDGHLQVVQQKEAGKGYGARLAIPLDLHLDEIGMSVGDVIERCRDYAAPGETLLRQKNGQPLERSNLSTRFAEVMRTAFGAAAYAEKEWPSLHELRSLSERLYREQGVDTQALLGHSDIAMTNKYNDDRGLTQKEFKRVGLAPGRSSGKQ